MSLRKLIGFIHPRIAVVLHDLAMAALAWWLAKLLRYTLKPDEIVSFHMLEIPIVLLVQGLIFRWTGLYRSVWRFASLPDLWNILRAAVFGAAGIYAALFLYDRLDGVPRSVLLLYPILLAMLLGSSEIDLPVLEGQPQRSAAEPDSQAGADRGCGSGRRGALARSASRQSL